MKKATTYAKDSLTRNLKPFNPNTNTSTYHAILFKVHAEKAKILVKSNSFDQLFSELKNLKVEKKRPEPRKPKFKLRLWEDLDGIRDLIKKHE